MGAEKLLVKFLDHYEFHRETYKKWSNEDICSVFVKNYKIANTTTKTEKQIKFYRKATTNILKHNNELREAMKELCYRQNYLMPTNEIETKWFEDGIGTRGFRSLMKKIYELFGATEKQI